MNNSEITLIPLEKLHPHPLNANVMSAETCEKLARHIQATGNYEPLVVRPHPTLADNYQLINGHHRAQILQQLEFTEAQCLVWQLDDQQTLLLLATVNRLSGSDAPGKRLVLLESLADALKNLPLDGGLSAWLPEDEVTLQRLLQIDLPPLAAPPRLEDMPEALTFFLMPAEKRTVMAALRQTNRDPAKALLQWAKEC